uniref:hypothetical protein n=1 Tax=Candidatus Xiphinematobacter sp. Idaho Grape TaxID=1704307 RepID=UPI00130DBF6E|nr:hypothetical protein [Candidatus Xiphinematobacter sp. Idaho Grape]
MASQSHTAEAIETGADAVLVNTAVAVLAGDPVQMAWRLPTRCGSRRQGTFEARPPCQG